MKDTVLLYRKQMQVLKNQIAALTKSSVEKPTTITSVARESLTSAKMLPDINRVVS
jgi:hypothetical protein